MYISDKTSDNTQMSSSHVTRWGTNKAAQSIVISTQFDIGVNMLLAWCEHSLWLRDVLCLSLSLLVCATNTKWHNNNRPWMSHCVIRTLIWVRGWRVYRNRLGTGFGFGFGLGFGFVYDQIWVSVLDLVLLSVKSESRSRIWYWSGIILSPGFGTGLNLSFCAHWFMFDINATLVVYL